MRNLHLPIWLGELNQPRQPTFAILFGSVAVCRTIMLTVLPLQVHALLGDVQNVSLLYFAVSLVGLCGSLTVPVLVAQFKRRWVFTAGACSAVAAAALIGTGGFLPLILGMMFQVFSITAMEITLNLYVMDHVPRRELGRFEPMRIFTGAGVWTIGPWLGVFLKTEISPMAPYFISAVFAVISMGYFWVLRFKDDVAVQPMKRRPVNPVRFIKRFFSQPRLVLAWCLALGRSGWWSMFFIYAPIFAVESGLGENLSGMIISFGMACVFAVPLWGALGRRWGYRKLLLVGYGLAGCMTIGVAILFSAPWLAVITLVLSALAATLIDGAGNIPFLRAVHPYERPEMTAVFSTYRDVGQMAPPAVFSVLLRSFDLWAVFAAGGCGMIVLAWFSRHIPRRL